MSARFIELDLPCQHCGMPKAKHVTMVREDGRYPASCDTPQNFVCWQYGREPTHYQPSTQRIEIETLGRD